VTYHWKSLECELCKTIYPDLQKTKYSLVTYEKPQTDYMILESISSSPTKSIYVTDLNDYKNTFKIGRGQDVDIRVSDISVSRFHATIAKTENNELVIKDNNSKFGTLV
jgi:pSer/pThr/pTyr-binding forkhead associated (FHA) protein